jgi:hypothetical protein
MIAKKKQVLLAFFAALLVGLAFGALVLFLPRNKPVVPASEETVESLIRDLKSSDKIDVEKLRKLGRLLKELPPNGAPIKSDEASDLYWRALQQEAERALERSPGPHHLFDGMQWELSHPKPGASEPETDRYR